MIENEALFYFHRGTATRMYEYFGVHFLGERDGRYVYAFRVFAPRAARVSVTGDFNAWCDLPMIRIDDMGIWEAVYGSEIPLEGMRYRYRLVSSDGVELALGDPFARAIDIGSDPPSIVHTSDGYEWQDKRYMATHRKARLDSALPMIVYRADFRGRQVKERRGERYLNYREIADVLIPQLIEGSYTHVMLPLNVESSDGSASECSYGHRFAPDPRFGAPDDLKYFTDAMHRAGIGVILDCGSPSASGDGAEAGFFGGRNVCAKGGKDAATGDCTFDLERPEVRSFFLSSAFFWLRRFHIDGICFDIASVAVGGSGTSVPDFFGAFNDEVHREFPGAFTVADGRCALPLVTHSPDRGGAGFDLRINAGWADDLIDYIAAAPVERREMYRALTFPSMYAFSEKYILPIYGNGVLRGRAFGTARQREAIARAMLAYMMTQPGKKLIISGQGEIDRYLSELNALYIGENALWQTDHVSVGFEWLRDGRDDECLVSFRRFGLPGNEAVCVFNFSENDCEHCRIPVGGRSRYREAFNSDAERYGGEGRLNYGVLTVMQDTIFPRVPPLSAVIFTPDTTEYRLPSDEDAIFAYSDRGDKKKI